MDPTLAFVSTTLARPVVDSPPGTPDTLTTEYWLASRIYRILELLARKDVVTRPVALAIQIRAEERLTRFRMDNETIAMAWGVRVGFTGACLDAIVTIGQTTRLLALARCDAPEAQLYH